MHNKIYIGTSGWSYDHWKETFFPKDLKREHWLNFLASEFPTVEINTTFYHLPKRDYVKNWYKQVPEDFLFSVKASRYITHIKRLNDCKNSLQLFYESIKPLKEKQGPILFQLPPSFQMNKERIEEFIDLLKPEYRYTFEFRHPSWFVDEIYALLERHHIALCITDLNHKLSPEVVTTDFAYIRLHGPKRAYKGSYTDKALKDWKKKILSWNVSTYCYFDNDEKGYATIDASRLRDIF
jgi:uncharacterized protein YecE (DUF72 family)